MISAIELTNFKCFRHCRIPFKPLTLLTGINNAGKSTAIQALLLIHQNCISQGSWSNSQISEKKFSWKMEDFCLSGALIDLGLPSDVLYSSAEEDFFSISMSWEHKSSFSMQAKIEENTLAVKETCGSYIAPEHLYYLSAERLCPTTLFPVPTSAKLAATSIGNHGEFAAYLLHVNGLAQIAHANELGPNLRAPNIVGNSLQMQTEGWLSQFGAPVRLSTLRPEGTDSIVLRFALPDISQTYFRPTNVGFGLTYALPIFVAALRAPAESLLIVENPEAHLHPKGQSLIGHFLARAAACGIQVIIETHSDHVLNGIRVAVKQGDISQENVQINFFSQHDGNTSIATPMIDKNGHINEWPEDFFDEWDKQLLELL